MNASSTNARAAEDGLFSLAKIIDLKWSFQCLVCIRAWRERALKRQGLPRDEILAKLNAEYPLVRSLPKQRK